MEGWLEPEPLGVDREPLKPGGRAVDGPHLPLVGHAFGAVGGLAAGGGAGIENAFAGLGVEQEHDALGLAVLHAPVALGVARPCPQIPRTIQQGEPLRQIGQGLGPQAGLRQLAEERGPIGAQGVDAQIKGRRAVAGQGEALHRIGGLPGEELLGEPEGKRLAQGEGGRGILRQGKALPGQKIGGQVGIGSQGLALPLHVSQEAIHHGSQPLQAALAGQLHRGAHRGGGRHALEAEELVEAHVQEPAELGGLALGGNPSVGGDPAIEEGPLADGPVGQIGGQGPIPGGQAAVLEGPLQGGVGIGAGGHGLEHAPGQAAGGQAADLWCRRGGGGAPQGQGGKQVPS